MALVIASSVPALPMTEGQRENAIRALEMGDREARTETNSLQSYMKLRPGCIGEGEVADFFDRRRRFSALREDAGSWGDADNATLTKALAVMRDNAQADEELALEMKRKAKSHHC
jgi:hypothetical protein